jgi:anti-sigma-K factor RskA
MRVELPKGGVTPAAAAVSLEPVGGMPQPTGPIVMMGELKI